MKRLMLQYSRPMTLIKHNTPCTPPITGDQEKNCRIEKIIDEDPSKIGTKL